MGLFRRKKRDRDTLFVEGRSDLGLVSEEEVDEMANALATETYELFSNEREDDGAAEAEAMGFFYVTKRPAAAEEGLHAAGAVARVGYMARTAEWQRLTTARKPTGWAIAGLKVAIESNVAQDMEESGSRNP